MADILSTFQRAYAIPGAAAQANQQARDERQVRQLAPQVIAGDPQAQAQIAAIDPQAATAYTGQRNDLLGRTRMAAQYLQTAIKAGDPAAIAAARQQIKPFMDTLHPESVYPLDRDPAQELPMIEGFLAQTANLVQGQQELAPRVVGDALVDSTGKVLYQAPTRQEYQWSDRAGAWIPKPGGVPAAATGQVINGPNGPFRIDPGIDPQDIPAAMADGMGGGTQDSYNLPPQLSAIPVAGIAPKPDISPAEAIRLQLAQEANQRAAEASARADRGEARADRAEQRSIAANAISGRPPTEDERKAAGWLNQAEFARQQMEEALRADPEAALPGVIEAYAPSEELRNRSMSPQRQRYAQAASSFAEAALRAATGAGINIFEAQQKIRELTPQRGDSREVIAQKGRAQQQYIESLRARAGRALQQQPANPAPGAAPALPPGFTWEN